MTSRRHSAQRTVATTPAQQHDLASSAARSVVTHASLKTNDCVLEVGPGLGGLTTELLSKNVGVIAIERDPQRIDHLRERFAPEIKDHRLTLIGGDATKVNPTLPARWHVVANPPFTLTAVLVKRWLLADSPPQSLTLVLQRQAAEKLTGGDGNHTRSSVLTHIFGRPAIVGGLQRAAVTPPSRVDLAIWRLRRSGDAPSGTQMRLVDALLAHAFAGPHTMADALRGLATSTQIRRQAAEHGWDPTSHPRTVPPTAWLPFASLLAMCGKLGVKRRPSRSPH